MFPLRDTVPGRFVPVVTVTLVAVNALVFLVEMALPPDMRQEVFYFFGLVPARFRHPEWAAWAGFPAGDYWPFITSMFLHGGWLHLIANMWSLWLFGDNVEDRMGPLRFGLFYLITGLAAGLTHYLTQGDSTVPTVGASGAVAGVMGAYFMLFPRARLVVLVPLFLFPLFLEVPAVLYLGLWFLVEFLSGTLSLVRTPSAGGIAFWAHVGGFASGALLVPLFLRRRTYRRWYPDESLEPYPRPFLWR